MRRLLAWLAGIAGGVAAYRVVAHRRAAVELPAAPDGALDPAAVLRAKLEESRALVDEQERDAALETPVDVEAPEERRRRVHEQGRAALDQMRRNGGS